MHDIMMKTKASDLLNDIHEIRSIREGTSGGEGYFLNVAPHKIGVTKPLLKSKTDTNGGSMILHSSSITNHGINSGPKQIVEHIKIGLQTICLPIGFGWINIESCLNKIILACPIGRKIIKATRCTIMPNKAKKTRELTVITAVLNTLCHPMQNLMLFINI
jgi:hypothetical protein